MQVLAVPPFSRQGFGLSFFVYVFFLHLVYFCKLFAFGLERGLLCLWLFVKASFGSFWLRQFFSALVVILQAFCVRVRKGLVVFVAICKGFVWFFLATPVFFCIYCVFCKLFSFGLERGLLCLWLFARLRLVIFGYASFFCIYCYFANFLCSGRKLGVLWFCKLFALGEMVTFR